MAALHQPPRRRRRISKQPAQQPLVAGCLEMRARAHPGILISCAGGWPPARSITDDDVRRALLPPTAFDRWCFETPCRSGTKRYQTCAETRQECEERAFGDGTSTRCVLVAGEDRGPILGDFPAEGAPAFGAALDAPAPGGAFRFSGPCADDG